MLLANQLAVSRAGRLVFRGLDLSLSPGGLVQVLGTNGSGKTSLLRALCGLLAPVAGTLTWRGRPVRAGDPAFLRAVCYIGHADGIDPDLSAAESLGFAARMAGLRGIGTAHPRVREALEAVGLGAMAATPVRRLSQGQRRRVVLARLSLAWRELWLLDEPLASLDDHAAGLVLAQLDAHLRVGGMAVVATHQPLAPSSGTGSLLRLRGAG